MWKKVDDIYSNLPDYLMEWVGLGFSSPQYVRHCLYFLYLPALVVIVSLGLYDLFKDDLQEWNVGKVSGIFETISTFGQSIIRIVFLLLLRGETIRSILQARKHFWRYEVFGEKFGMGLKREIDIAWFLIRTFCVTSILTVIAMSIAPFLTSDRQVPLQCWTPENSIIRTTVYLVEIVCLLLELAVVISFDGFFMVMSTEIKLQFRLLNRCLSTIRVGRIEAETACEDKLKGCIDHHRLLLSTFKKLQSAYSELLLGQYFIFLSGACIEIFTITDKSTKIGQHLRSLIYTMSILLQLSLFFIPASYLADEADRVANTIYSIDWYNSSRRFQKRLLFMLMKVQQPLNMTGCGLFYVNRRVFIQLFRVAFSLAAIMGESSQIRLV